MADPVFDPAMLPRRLHDLPDRWAHERPDAPAIVDHDGRELCYRELGEAIESCIGLLREAGVRPGDRVMVVNENAAVVAAMLFAIGRLEAWAVLLNARLAAPEIDQIAEHCRPRALVFTHEVSAEAGAHADRWGATPAKLVHVGSVRIAGRRESEPEPVHEASDQQVAALVYTSGTTGKPKGTVHTHCSLVAKIALDVGLCMDMKETDRLFWMSDIGWLVGPLASISSSFHGASFVLFEGAPDYPDTGRHWRAMSENKVTYLGIAPTSVRSLMRYGDEVDKFDFSSLRIMVSTGEPWTFDAWKWLFERVGKKRVPILNYTGGTECGGGIAAGTVLHPLKPGCFAGPIPGTGARVVDDSGKPVAPGTVGELVMTVPSIGNTRSLWHDDERFIESYYSMFGDKWRQGDFAMIDADGFWYLLGRSDDTIKVSGKRTGPSEIEGILTGTGKIVEAAVIGLPDQIKGSTVGCVCVPMPGVDANESLRAELSNAVVAKMGSSYRPKEIIFVSDLPKTRNLKIMRRMVRSVILGDPAGDTSSLVNPESLDELRARISK